MKEYLKLTLGEDPDHFILNVRTNFLSIERSPELTHLLPMHPLSTP